MKAVALAVVCWVALMSAVRTEATEGKHWALLVAGSNEWYNYRHQADICHAYQVLHNHGIPDERIVVMMYDDIANNKQNPTPGVIINHPSGQDVYHGVPRDYTGKDVTPEVFLKVLTGDAAGVRGIGSQKVIASGPNDHVFVNFADHGAPNLVAFPIGELHAADFLSAIMSMHTNSQFQQMVIYIEACESGSMFKNLPTNINVFATTASNGKESSYACYFDKQRETYLGDVYSVKWMEDSDKEDLTTETLQDQFKIVRRETNTSHVQEFGMLSMGKEPVADFQGKAEGVVPVTVPRAELDAVASEDVPLAILSRRLQTTTDEKTAQQIQQEIHQIQHTRREILKSMRSIVSLAAGDPADVDRLLTVHQDLTQEQCYKAAVTQYDTDCWDISTYDFALRQLHALVNLCEEQRPTFLIQDAIHKVCTLKLY